MERSAERTVTTDQGLMTDDVSWVFFGGEEGVIVGSTVDGMDDLVSHA